MQEDPTSVPEGETPRSLLMFTFDTNVDAVKPGDKVVMTGTNWERSNNDAMAGCWYIRIA
jgi:DNA replicative helicase MCM subunit Mcm2 (Cdc46/Mcm family)